MNNFYRGLLGAIAVTSVLGFNPSPATAQLTPAEQRSAECLGYAVGALISGNTSQLCGNEELSELNNSNPYQNSNYYNQAAEQEYRRQREIENYHRDLKYRQQERRRQSATYGLNDGVCLSCSD